MRPRSATNDPRPPPEGDRAGGAVEARRRAHEVPDVVGSAADPWLQELWSYSGNAMYERRLWFWVLHEQIEIGLELDRRVLHDYWQFVDGPIDEESIAAREAVTRHDVKARIEEYNAQAGRQSIHLGMTSADVVDNITLCKLRDSLVFLGTAYPHAESRLLECVQALPWRGIKGAVGTQQDQVDLLGSASAANELDRRVARRMGFDRVLGSVNQVYPRSLDLQVVSALASACYSIRHPLKPVLAGYLAMVSSYQGDTWNEGDVSQSSVRRVALPGAVFTADCILGGKTP